MFGVHEIYIYIYINNLIDRNGIIIDQKKKKKSIMYQKEFWMRNQNYENLYCSMLLMKELGIVCFSTICI